MKTVVLAVCLLLAGCGRKDDRTLVRIGMLGPGFQAQQMPINLAAALGYFEAEGLEVRLETLPSNVKTLQALIGGSVDVAAIAYAQTIQLAAEGQRVRAFLIMMKRSSFTLMVAPQKAKIRRVEDLKGMVVGVPAPGSPTFQWLSFVLKAHGVSLTDVSTPAIGVSASAIAALERGQVDAAAIQGGEHIRVLRRLPQARVLLDSSTPEGMRATLGTELYASGAVASKQEWLDHNPDTARKLARAIQRALKWLATQTPEEIRAHLPESVRSQDAAADLGVIRWSLPGLTAGGRMPEGAPEAMKRYLDATVESVRDSKIDLAATWTNEFLPESK